MTQTITPERQQAAAQIGQVFNSLQEYLTTLMHSNAEGQRLTSQPLEYSRKAVEEASFWAIKHVLMHGVPPKPKAANEQPATETPAPIGEVDAAAPLPTDNGGTPAESI
jgi:hypothetical protein